MAPSDCLWRGAGYRPASLNSLTHGRDPADVDGVVTKVRPWSVAETVTRLAAVVDARKMKMFAVIDHSGEATNEGSRCAIRSSSSSAVPRQEPR